MPLGKRVDPSATKQTEQPAGIKTVPHQVPQNTLKSDNTDKSTEVTQFQAEDPKYSFSDIILNDSTYDSIQDVLVMYEKHDLLFNQWGLGERQKKQNRAGINLYGYSGTGKSMAAHAIADQLDRKILTVDYSQIESKYVGETSKNLVAMFDYAKESQAIIFFDEADGGYSIYEWHSYLRSGTTHNLI